MQRPSGPGPLVWWCLGVGVVWGAVAGAAHAAEWALAGTPFGVEGIAVGATALAFSRTLAAHLAVVVVAVVWAFRLPERRALPVAAAMVLGLYPVILATAVAAARGVVGVPEEVPWAVRVESSDVVYGGLSTLVRAVVLAGVLPLSTRALARVESGALRVVLALVGAVVLSAGVGVVLGVCGELADL